MSNAVLELVKAHMEAVVRVHERELNERLFSDLLPRVRVVPLTWRERLRMRAHRVKQYFATVWLALRGADAFEYDDY